MHGLNLRRAESSSSTIQLQSRPEQTDRMISITLGQHVFISGKLDAMGGRRVSCRCGPLVGTYNTVSGRRLARVLPPIRGNSHRPENPTSTTTTGWRAFGYSKQALGTQADELTVVASQWHHMGRHSGPIGLSLDLNQSTYNSCLSLRTYLSRLSVFNCLCGRLWPDAAGPGPTSVAISFCG